MRERLLLFTAVCSFPGKSAFLFHSDAFSIQTWSDLERAGQDAVAEAWANIADCPPPVVVGYLEGGLALTLEGQR